MSKMANGLIFLLLFCVSKYSCAEDTVETSQTLQGSTTGLNNTQAGVFVINDPVSLDEVTAMRRNKIKEMMKHAWDNYVKYAWGENELWPNSKRGNSKDSFGSARLGASIVGGLDTLYIMGMMDEFQQGRDWIANNLTLENIDAELVASEINVGIIGGLLSCYALTGDVVFRDKSQYIAQKLMPVFNSPTSIPFAIINTTYALVKNHAWVSGGSSILAEFGSLHLEFTYLSDVTGNGTYKTKVDQIRKFVKDLEKPQGLYRNFLNPRTGQWGLPRSSLGALGDRFYEYLLKGWIQSGKNDSESRTMYDSVIQAILNHTLLSSQGGHMHLVELLFGLHSYDMNHEACFAGGLLGLGAHTLKNEDSRRYMEIAENLTDTCHQSYNHTRVKLGPTNFYFTDETELTKIRWSEDVYRLRPDVIESYYILWKLTKDNKYREWAWEAVQAIETYCRTPNGYTGIRKLYIEYGAYTDNVQPPYFLGATLKYLYLLFSDDNLISLNEWVFNTEGHPLPIKGVSPYYRTFTQTQSTQSLSKTAEILRLLSARTDYF